MSDILINIVCLPCLKTTDILLQGQSNSTTALQTTVSSAITKMNVSTETSRPQQIPHLTMQPTIVSLETTSKKPPYTIPPGPIKCAVCSGPEFLCEKLYEVKQCDYPNNYCVNRLKNHKDGTISVTRECADFQTCYRDWFLGTSDSDKCRQFDENNVVTLEYECTFCCIQDRCNVPIKPADADLYTDL